jgi:hypothetical protein
VIKSFWNFSILALIIGFAFCAVGIGTSLTIYHRIYFIIGENSLKVVKKAICGSKTKVSNKGELERIDFLYKYGLETDSEGEKSYVHRYNLIISETKQKRYTILSKGSGYQFFTPEEIDYFLYFINNHIQTKMKLIELK